MDTATVTAITDAVDFAPIIVGIGTVAAAVGVVYIAMKGSKILLDAIRSRGQIFVGWGFFPYPTFQDFLMIDLYYWTYFIMGFVTAHSVFNYF